jgi:hypothetical protein
LVSLAIHSDNFDSFSFLSKSMLEFIIQDFFSYERLRYGIGSIIESFSWDF